MNVYKIALFLHVVAAIGYSLGFAISLLGLAAMRRAARVEQVRTITQLIGMSNPIAIVSGLVLVGAGLYMAGSTWGWDTGWIIVSLIGTVLIVPLGIIFGPRRQAVGKMAQDAPDGRIPSDLHACIHDPWMATALNTTATLLLGLIFLMTNKPSLTDSIIALGVAIAVGIVSGLLLWRRAPADTTATQPATPKRRTTG